MGAWEACGLVVLVSVLTGAAHIGGVGARVVQVVHKVAGSGSERAHACVHVFASAGSRGKHGGIRGRLVDWPCAFSIVHVYCPSAQWRHVGAWVGSGRPQWWRVCAWVGQVGRKAAAYSC